MRRRRAITEKPAPDLVEESIALLRRCPLEVGVLYYVGAIPFVLLFLYFWADMSRGAFARDRVVESSLCVAIAFLWCKCWQAVFATHLLALAAHRQVQAWNWRKLARLAVGQAILQPSGLFVLPIAAVITLPFGFAYAFYQNVSVLALDGTGEPQESAALRKEAMAQARRWPAQNHVGLLVLSFFGLIVFLNILIMIMALPGLMKSILGIETMFSRSTYSMLNTTLFAVAWGLTYLCVGPILTAFYTLRCFHGRSLSTGEDLQVRLRAASKAALSAAALLLVCCSGIAHGADRAETGSVVQAANIDRSIGRVLDKPEFAWRGTREEASPEKEGGADGFMAGIIRMIGRWMKPVKRWAHEFWDWLIERFMHREMEPSTDTGTADWRPALQLFAWIFCGVAVCAAIVIGWKFWLRRNSMPVQVTTAPSQAVPDLTAEDVSADLLPEDAWITMAREMIGRGELRLALRAFYLAALSHLSERQIISIARYKSNYEYQRELRRRRPAQGELIDTFSETVRTFERAWYGMHEVTPDILTDSESNLETIRKS